MFRSVHKNCEIQRAEALKKFDVVVKGYLGLPDGRANIDGLSRVFSQIASLAHLDADETDKKFHEALRSAIITITDDDEITDQELARISEISAALGADVSNIDETTQIILIQALLLRDLKKGVVQSRVPSNHNLPITLKRGEALLWLNAPVTRLEPRTKTRYVGRSQGFSFRIMRGVSYRVGASEGERIHSTELVQAGTGGLAYTNQAVYFLSQGNNLRLPAKSIATVDCYSDGICVSPSRGKSQVFLMKECKFASDMIKAICALQ